MQLLRPGTRLRQMAAKVRSLSSAAWTPTTSPGIAVTLLVAQMRAAGKLWQDTGKTTPAVASNDPVKVAVCPYTALEWTAPSDAARPLLTDDGSGKWSLTFDGTDDLMVISSLNAVGTAPGVTLYVQYRGLAASAKGLFFKDGSSGGYGWGVGSTSNDANGANLVNVREGVAFITGLGTHQQSGTLTSTASTTAGTTQWRNGTLGGSDAANIVPPTNIGTPAGGVSVGAKATAPQRFCGYKLAGLLYYAAAVHGAASRAAAETYLGVL